MLNLLAIQQRIAAYERQYHQTSGNVRLLAASKGQSTHTIAQAIANGQCCFGENYLQEALKKISALPADIEWHFIGPIQSNKTRKIAEHFDWVQSVATMKIAKRLNDQRPTHLPRLNICIEVNISGETTKSGANIDTVLSLAQYCLTLPRLHLRGLMSIPAPQHEFALQRQTFRQLHELYQSLQQTGIELDTLSMGMSDDFEAAIAEGATLVRIGSALFGKRN